jgi:hypothetical protein
MSKKKELSAIRERLIEQYPDEDLLLADGLDDAIIGVCTDFNAPPRVIYSVKKCIEILAKGMDVKKSDLEKGQSIRDKKYELALEWFDFNVSGGYVGKKTPVWCHEIED